MSVSSCIYLSVAQVLAVHDQMIRRFGGSLGIRDLGLVESAVERPKATFDKDDLYPDIFGKVAALLQSILKNHAFIDGNKRTALTATGVFLRLNGYILNNNHHHEVSFTLEVDSKNLTLEQIAKWIKDRSKQV